MVAALSGLLVGLGVAALARWRGFDRDRSFYPTVLIVIATYFVLFAVLTGDRTAILIQSLVAAGFVAIALIGHRAGIAVVAAGIAAHGVYDFAYAELGLRHGAPQWWPAFCGAADIVLGAAAIIGLKRVTEPALPAS